MVESIAVIRIIKCPVCRKPAHPDFTPFCSKRCADVDLNRWLVEGYTIPAVELDDVDFGDESGE